MRSTIQTWGGRSLLVAMLCGAAAHAEPYRWKNVAVGAGGYIPGIVFSRVEKGLAYLRSDMGGCYCWDDKAKSWRPLMDELAESSYMGGESIAPDPVDANTVYVAAGMYHTEPAAILRSHDRGKTWDVFPVPFHMGGNEDGRGMGERLAVDPNDPKILYFGSRFDGLMRSEDRAATWKPVSSFPVHGRGNSGRGTAAGLSFVLFDRGSSKVGSATRSIFVASAEPGAEHLFHSSDAGATWSAVPGGPPAEMLPAKGEIDDNGKLIITYGDGMGPNGVKSGAVFAFDARSKAWTDITPEPLKGSGGYCGVSLDRSSPGALAVATIDHWSPTDNIWRTADGGKSWKDFAAESRRDVAAAPYLLWGKEQPRLGWWMTALAIDPFNSNHATYATGATIYATDDLADINRGSATQWKTWTDGIEQTAIITLVSPASGPHLISGFGDIGGFVHDNLDQSPPQGMFLHPQFTTTDELDVAGVAANVVVRAGRAGGREATLAVSDDSGKTWQPLTPPQGESDNGGGGGGRQRRGPRSSIAVSADGGAILAVSGGASLSLDHGKTWKAVQGFPAGAQPIADRVDPKVFYTSLSNDGQLSLSTDGGASFHGLKPSGLPTERDGRMTLSAVPGRKGELWLVGGGKLLQSRDGGQRFAPVKSDLNVQMLSFGKAAPGSEEPALFAIGSMNDTRAVWRSDDNAAHWQRLNDERHEWGRRFRCISGDMRIFGRVYVGTDGRGIFYGEPGR